MPTFHPAREPALSQLTLHCGTPSTATLNARGVSVRTSRHSLQHRAFQRYVECL